MALKRLIELTREEASKIRARQKAKTMGEYYDSEQYLCFETKELETYRPRKSGRPPTKTN